MALATISVASAAVQRRPRSAVVVPVVVIGLIIIVGLITSSEVPIWLDTHIQPWAIRSYKWITLNRRSNWLFTDVLSPIADVLNWCVARTLGMLQGLRWPGVVALTAVVGWLTGGVRAAMAGAFAIVGVGVLGYWDLTMVTLSLMLVSIVIALIIGVPLGVWCAKSTLADKIIRPILDTAQVLPVFVYLGVLVLGLGIQYPPAIIATVIYAVPPAVRITSLGLRQVPEVMTEVGRSFGTTSWQQLRKVELPIARPTILLGLNQVIMMAFGIVVIGSLLGTGDTGGEVLNGLEKNNVGLAFKAGLAIVLAAIALDRITTGQRANTSNDDGLSGRQRLAIGAGIVVSVAVVARIFGTTSFPTALTVDIESSINSAVTWVKDNIRSGIPVIGGTATISDGLVTYVLDPMKRFLQWLPWLVVVAAFAAIGWASKGWRLAVLVSSCLIGIAAMGPIRGTRTTMWNEAMDTLSQVVVAVAISVAIAVPLGIWAARRPAVFKAMRPLLDVAQVMPQFVYLVPVLFLVNPGRSAGVVASVIYATPPCIRLTALGLREVPFAPREAAISFGATPGQELRKVQLPLAFKSVMLGINQTVLMVLATVIIAALIGGGALGFFSLGGFQKQQQQIGRGLAAGLSIVFLAIILDRITQAWGSSRADDRRR